MTLPQTLEQTISGYLRLGFPLPEVTAEIKNNLNPAFDLRPYQTEAFGRFIFYLNNDKLRQKPAQLLFHMATGSGKTLIMAGAILYLYQQGFRNFLFFVNSTNIINKTRDNFLNPFSAKFLFAENIMFGDKKVRIREVFNFQAANPDDINIVFSTIQGLHSRLNTPRENSVTYDDFIDKKCVLISDEAHHINVDTKKGKLTKEEQEEVISWEGTVNRIFRLSPDNILLEYTATIDESNPDIALKYADKILFKYPLKQFRIDGYSKEVKVLQSDVKPIERALQAVILSQHRRKIFEKYKNRVKPVILFKSKTIAESKAFYKLFIEAVDKLTPQDVSAIRARANTTLASCFSYFDACGITPDNLIAELQNDFSADRCIEVNSNEESEAKQIAVNTLEAENNEYRTVFAVDKLNEGWDVLNLFDIVRLYNTRDAKLGRPGKTTISEAQLIGRGARYCPFRIEDHQSKYQRKYDEDLGNELRVCEELYYHSAFNPKYIQELTSALQEIGIKAKEAKEISLKIKPAFKDSYLFKGGLIFLNDQVRYDRSGIFSLPNTITERLFKYSLHTGSVQAIEVFEEAKVESREVKQQLFGLSNFGYAVIHKATSKLEFYRFDNLKSYLPNVASLREFITSDKYLGKIQIEVSEPANKLEPLGADEKLTIAIDVLGKIADALQSNKIEHQGTEEFTPHPFSKVIKDKTISVCVREGGDQEKGIGQSETANPDLNIDLSKRDWYVFNDNYGTSQEKYFVKFIEKTYNVLKAKYDQVFLVRNERHFQLYNFDDGTPLEPDFVLFLKKNDPSEELHYQVFIEPKGEHLLVEDAWKEKYLDSLRARHKIKPLWKTKRYVIWGMPFYNEVMRKKEFQEKFDDLLK